MAFLKSEFMVWKAIVTDLFGVVIRLPIQGLTFTAVQLPRATESHHQASGSHSWSNIFWLIIGKYIWKQLKFQVVHLTGLHKVGDSED